MFLGRVVYKIDGSEFSFEEYAFFNGMPIRYNDVNLFCGKAPSCTLRPRSLVLLCFLKK